MKKLFLIGIAALSVLSVATTRTSATKAKLPDAMLGDWCGKWGWQFPGSDNDAMHWWRTDDVKGCGNRGGIHVRKDGWDYHRFGPQGSCKFTLIEFRRRGKFEDHIRPLVLDPETKEYVKAKPTEIPPSDVYLIRATCKDKNETWYESYEVQTSDDWLFTSVVPAAHERGYDACAVVLKPPAEVTRDKDYNPDTWLSLREGPGTQYKKMEYRLREGDFLYLDTDVRPDKWVLVVGVLRLDGNMDNAKKTGYIYRKYILEFSCPEDQEAEGREPSLPPPSHVPQTVPR